MNSKIRFFLLAAGIGAVGVACSSSDDHAPPKTATAAVVAGAADTHCGTDVVTVDPNVCVAGDPSEAGADGGAGEADAGEAAGGDYGATLYGSEGDDDDCKYHVKWSAASGAPATASKGGLTLHALRPLHGGEEHGASGGADGGDVTFTVTLTNKADGTPVTGAPIDVEAFQSDTHPAPNTDQVSKEISPGTYTVGPVRFDVSGQWTVRFHIHDDCDDSETSPHGHAAFFMQITVQ
jgi:hypothetical protein